MAASAAWRLASGVAWQEVKNGGVAAA